MEAASLARITRNWDASMAAKSVSACRLGGNDKSGAGSRTRVV